VRIRESSYLHDLCTFIRPFPVTRLLVIPHNAQQIVIPPFAFMTFRCPLPLNPSKISVRDMDMEQPAGPIFIYREQVSRFQIRKLSSEKGLWRLRLTLKAHNSQHASRAKLLQALCAPFEIPVKILRLLEIHLQLRLALLRKLLWLVSTSFQVRLQSHMHIGRCFAGSGIAIRPVCACFSSVGNIGA
jgi:hypothetical protein